MIGKEPVGEYEVRGIEDVSFETSPALALQHVVGALLPSSGQRETGQAQEASQRTFSLDDLHNDLATACADLRQHIEDWRKAMQKVRSPKPESDNLDLAEGLEETRCALERSSLAAAVALQNAHIHFLGAFRAMSGSSEQVFLALPSPFDESQIATRAGDMVIGLSAVTPKQDGNGDGDLPLLLARSDLLSEEITQSLKEISRQAKWLWTNEPEAARVKDLIVWMFDLRCECLELAPVLCCLAAPLALWRNMLGPTEQHA